MSKVYERRFSLADGTQIELIHADDPGLIRIDLPAAGLVKKLIVKQVADAGIGGAACAAKINLYNSQVGAISNVGSTSSRAADTVTKELAKIIPEQALVQGQAMELITANDGYAYRNQDGTDTVPDRAVYLEINPTKPSTGTAWEVAIAVVPSLHGE